MEIEIDKILTKYFNVDQNQGFNILKDYIKDGTDADKYAKTILLKITQGSFQKYLKNNNAFNIFFSLFKLLKSKKVAIENDIYYQIINAIYSIELKELNKVNIIVEIIKEEKEFVMKNFVKLLDNMVIPLLSENDIKKRNGGYFLDQIIKTGIGSLSEINFDEICEYLIKKLQTTDNNQNINNFIISWFDFLESLPGKDLTKFYIEIITKLVGIIKLDNKNEFELGELYLKKIIKNIISTFEEKKLSDITAIIELIIKEYKEDFITENEKFTFILFEILNKFLVKFDELLSNPNNNIKNIPFDLFPGLLKKILYYSIELFENQNLTESKEDSDMNSIIQSNSLFFNLMKKVIPDNDLKKRLTFENDIKDFLSYNLNEKSTNLVFDWISLLYNLGLYRNGDEELLNYMIDMIAIIKDPREYHIKRIIGMINMIKNNSPGSDEEIINKIIMIFTNRQFTEKFGFFILNELSNETIEITKIYKDIPGIISKIAEVNSNIYYLTVIIDMLTNYLIFEEKGKKVLEALNADKEFFESLYTLFCYSKFDSLALLLLTKSFELSYFFVMNLSRKDLNNYDLMELCKVVQIFESNFFIDVRVQLLNPKNHIYLTKTLYALSLLLPPGSALDALNYRLKCLEILYDFDEEEERINIESNLGEIKVDNSSKSMGKIEKDEVSAINLNQDHKKIFNELIQYMDEKDKQIFIQNKIMDKIEIFEKKQKR